MEQQNLNNGLVKITAQDGCVIRQIGSDPHSEIRSIVVKAEDVDIYEEVPLSQVPPYTKAEFDAKVAELVRQRYSESEEFALQRKMLNTLVSPMTLSEGEGEKVAEEYAEYNRYVERCKADAPAMLAAAN